MRLLLAIFLQLCVIGGTAFARDLRVLTMNAWGLGLWQAPYRAERIEKLKELLAAEAAKPDGWDIVLLQEVWLPRDQRLLAKAGFRYSSLAVTEKSRSGLLVLSRHPIEELQFIPYKTKAPIGREMAFFSKRALLLARLSVPGLKQELWVANTHLTANYATKGLRSFDDIRDGQANEAGRVLTALAKKSPVIFGGDFNMGPSEKPWRPMMANYLSAFAAAEACAGICTYGPPNVFVSPETAEGHLDHLFASKEHFTIDPGKVVLNEQFRTRAGREINVSDHFGWETILRPHAHQTCEWELGPKLLK